MIKVFIPFNLRRFTDNQDSVEVKGSTIGEVLDELESRFSGIKAELVDGDKIKPGLAFICGGAPARYGLREKVPPNSELHIVAAISGGEDTQAKVEGHFEQILAALVDEHPKIDKDGIEDTPKRMARMYMELLRGYRQNVDEVIGTALFDVRYDEMVVVRNIDFYSLCEHHLLPFYGRAHVGYLPNQKVVGLSKIPRVVEIYARRLQVQERLTEQIATVLFRMLDAEGVGVVIDATHLCTAMRGVTKPNATMLTSALRGTFKSNSRTREEFMNHLRQN